MLFALGIIRTPKTGNDNIMHEKLFYQFIFSNIVITSNMDPFTQKLIQRTQARKEARLKTQHISASPSKDCPVLDTLATPLNVNSASIERLQSSLQTRIPLAERETSDNNVNENENVSSSGIISPNKRRASTPEDLNSEKKASKLNLSISNREETSQVPATDVQSPIQKVTVIKTSIQESPKHIVKPSLASRLNKLNEQYTEQFQVDTEEEKQQKESEVLWAARKKQQEEESTRAIQETLFGKECMKQKEEEKIKKLREKYLGDTPVLVSTSQSVPQTFIKDNISKSNDIKPSCTRSERFCYEIFEKEDIVGDIKDIISDSTYQISGRCINKNIQETTEMDVDGKENMSDGEKEVSCKPKVKPKPASKLHTTERNPVHVMDNPHSIGRNIQGHPENERTRRGSVQDKKSIFEEKMRQEAAARTKEKEAHEWLQIKGCRRSANIDAAIVPATNYCNSEKVDTSTTKTSNANSNTHLAVQSKESNYKNDCIPMQVDKCVSSNNNIALHGNVKDRDNIKSFVHELKDDTDGDNKVVCKSINNTPVKPSSPSSEYNMTETPSKNYTGVNSPQPIDCTEDTIFCDTQAFDVTSSLQIAGHREEVQTHLKQERCRSNRCSTMKIEPSHLAMIKTLPELNMTRIENECTDEEMLSEFAKAIKNKVKDIKCSGQKQRFEAIDIKTQATCLIERKPIETETKTSDVERKTSDVEMKAVGGAETTSDHLDINKKRKTKGSGKHSAKPANIKNIETELEPNCSDVPEMNILSEHKGLEPIKERHYSADCQDLANIISKPDDNKYSHKKMRKSSSFSEGQGTTPVKSGYHRELSERYNACASFDKPDIVYSKKVQIQTLLEEAACQQNIVLQASQALNVAECSNDDKSNSPEVVEGERLLLLATERRTVCLEEVKILKENDNDPYLLKQSDIIPPCKATLALADIKLPLHREFVNSLKTCKSDLGMFHFVLIFFVGYKNIHSTKVVSCYDEIEDCALSMKSNIVMKNIPHDFTLTMKVFGMHSGRNNDQITKVKKNANSQSSPGNLKNLFSKRNKEEEYTYYASPQTVFRRSNFKLVGESKVNLSLFGNGLTKYALTKIPSNCPIEGCIQLRANCKPEYSANVAGFLTILDDVGGYTAWNRRWCIMKDDKILYWRYPDDEKVKEPMGSIDLRHCSDTVVKLLSCDICARPHTFELTLKRITLPSDCVNLVTTIDGKVTKIKYWVCCDNKEDRITWMDTVNKQLSDSRAWRLKKISLKSACSLHQE